MNKLGKYLALLLLLGGALGTTLFLVFNNDASENDYVNVIPDALSVNEGELFDLAIDSNLDLSALNIVSSNLSTVRLEGTQLKALRGGTVTLTVESQDGSVQDQVLITVNPLVTEVPLEDTSFEVVLEGERFTFNEPVSISQLDAPLLEGYTFMGFSLEENGEVLESDAVIDESLTLYSIYQAIEEETPETPVVDEGDSENEDETDEDSETPMDEDDESSVSTPSSITVTLESDQGITMSVLTVSPGALVSAGAFDGELSEVGYFLKGETCENPFDFDTPLVTDTSIVFGETNYTSPCIELDEMATLGKLQVGETIQAFVSPSAATITYEWFISDNDRDYSLLSNVTGSSLELVPEHFRQYIAVKLTGTGDYTGSLSLPLGRVGLSSQTVGSGDSGDSGGSSCTTFTDINDYNDFINMTPNGCYKLTADIDLNSYNLNRSALDFVFTGTLDGDNYTIKNLSISSTGIDVGLFRELDGATIRNVTLSAFNITGNEKVGGIAGVAYSVDDSSIISNIYFTNSNIHGSGNTAYTSYVGGLIGRTYNSEFENIQVTNVTISGVSGVSNGTNSVGGLIGNSVNGPIINNAQLDNVTVFGDERIGGIIGSSSRSEITNSTFIGTVLGQGIYKKYIGGIIGRSSSSEITNSSFNGTVSGDKYVGGIVGYSDKTDISKSSFDGTLSGVDLVGGIAGQAFNTVIEESFNTGQVTATYAQSYAGGIAGQMLNGSQIINSYNTGNVSASGQYVGGLTGHILNGDSDNPNQITDSYSSANVTGSIDVGSVVGLVHSGAHATFTDIFWNTDIGSVSSGIGTVESGAVTNGSITGVTAGAMIDIATFTSWSIYAYSDLDGIWTIGGADDQDTYPWLSWTKAPDDSVKYDPQIATLIASGYIPLSSPEDFLSITSTATRLFAEGSVYQTSAAGGTRKNYVLVDDIDFSEYNTFTTAVINNGFFVINISGMGFTISNVNINGAGDLGLFHSLNESAIDNLNLSSFNVTGSSFYNGILAAQVDDTIINNMTITNSSIYNTGSYTGGLIGRTGDNARGSNPVTISGVVVNTLINGRDKVGGIVGFAASNLTITKSINNSPVNGRNEVGGIVGDTAATGGYSYHFEEVINTGKIESNNDYPGGILGLLNNTLHLNIINSFNVGEVTGVNGPGGLIGRSQGIVVIENSYLSAVINGTDSGSIVGKQDELNNNTSIITFSGIIWNSTLSPHNAIGVVGVNATNSGVKSGNTSDDMKSISTFTTNDYDWDFDTIWNINNANNGYPYLRWAEAILTED